MAQTTGELTMRIEEQRSVLGYHLDELGDKVSPRRMAERRKAAMRDRVSSIKDRVMQEHATSRSVADRLSYKQGVGGSIPPSSTVAEVEVVDTPGRGPGGSRFESGRSPHRRAHAQRCTSLRGIWDQRGLIRLARGFDSRPRDQRTNTWAGGVIGSASPLQGEGCGFESRAVHTTKHLLT